MMASDHDELAWLTQALRGHLEWARMTGSLGAVPSDAEWLERRRAQYRAFELTGTSDEPDTSGTDAVAERGLAAPNLEPARTPNTLPSPGPPTSAAPAATSSSESSSSAEAALRPAPEITNVPVPSAPVPPLPEGERAQRLTVLESEVRSCTRCALHETRTQTVFSRGTSKSGICFVGEGPGADEDRLGSPFVGAAGQLLDRMIAAMGFERDEVYVCNIVKCRPPNNRKPEASEMQACRPFLMEQLELLDPKVIVALGGTAVEGLLGLTGIMRLRGQWKLYRGRVPVMPTLHPAYLLRQPQDKRLVWEDLQKVMKELGLALPKR